MVKKIRVAQIITGLELGGGGQVVWTIARNIDRSRFEIDVFCVIGGGELVDDVEDLGFNVRIVPAYVEKGFPKYRPAKVLELARHLRRGKYDVAHTHLFKADLIGGVAARLARIPRIVKSLHNMGSWKKPRHLFIDRLLARGTDRVICCSRWLSESAIRQERLDPQRVKMIHHGVDPARFQVNVGRSELLGTLGLDPHKRVIGTVGRPVQEKGHAYLLDAVPQVLAANPDAQFLIVGDGPLRESLQAQIQRMGLSGVVRMPGARADIPELLSVMDMFVFPSTSEGLGIAVLEAMAARVPVVASNIRPLSEIVEDKSTGLLVEPRSPAALADAINRLLASPALADQMRHRAFAQVSTRFSERGMVSTLEDLYSGLCHSGPSGLSAAFLSA